jgi:leucyl-tRNA synthetase
MNYDHKEIEKKWQEKWEQDGVYKTLENSDKPKQFVLDMFPYPSGEGLHVGHPRGYMATDVYSRMKRMQGFNVLHPMGWDAFGLPAENYAIKNKVHPRAAVEANVARFKKQLGLMGVDYDWSREINTTDPAFYKWTQWIFLQMYKKGLAYESWEPINWCPGCQTGLANEDVESDRTCERCGSKVEKKPMRQWVLKITDYADRLLADLDKLPKWPEGVKEAQRNWIGKSEGAEIDFKIVDADTTITVFTTRADTLFGVTYVVLAPEHPLIQTFDTKIQNYEEVVNYISSVKDKSDIDRTNAKKEKTGVKLEGVFAINPANNEQVPVWVADYVLANHGTGAVMAVPAHDERDFEFAQKYNLPMIDMPLVDVQEIVNQVGGKLVSKYKIKDWVFSRQRYWGEPIPVIHCEKCGVVAVPEQDLPVTLPDVSSYAPTGTGESPLANITEWVNTACPTCGGAAKRETNTMPQWAGSSWYYLRYIDPQNNNELVAKDKEKDWMNVDVYVGGDHATRHLIYARFWHKFLFDIGNVSTEEPFPRLEFLGFILAHDGQKMSKSKGNVINPDKIVETFGADSLRVYEMFMGPFDQAIAWSTDGLVGVRRFLEKVWRVGERIKNKELRIKGENQKINLENLVHKTVKKVGEDIESMRFNTAISSMMICANEMDSMESVPKELFELYLKILSPFAPHIAEELWSQMGNKNLIAEEKWPTYDPKKIIDEEVSVIVQVNGKVRGQFKASPDISEEEAIGMAKLLPDVKKWLDGKEIKKSFFVKGRLINLVV